MPKKKSAKLVKPTRVLWPKGKAAPRPGQRLPRSLAEKKRIAAETKKKVAKTWIGAAKKSRKARLGRAN